MPLPCGDSDFERSPDDSEAFEVPANPEDRAGKYCLDCFYPLQGIGDIGRCPECGRPFNLHDLYSYSVEPRRSREWLWSHRLIALVIALALCTYPFLPVKWFCMLTALFPVWQFVTIICWFIALGLDRLADRVTVAVAAGAAIGVLTLLPIGWYPVLLIGGISGAFCGLQVFHMKLTGWLD